jgi:putative membrane protein
LSLEECTVSEITEPQQSDKPGDGTRRTHLADERTYLAWLRSGFAAFAVSLGAGKVLPALTRGSRWPYTVLGVGFAVVGVAFVVCGLVRQRTVDDAISRGEYVRLDEKIAAGLAVTIGLLGLVLLAVILFG